MLKAAGAGGTFRQQRGGGWQGLENCVLLSWLCDDRILYRAGLCNQQIGGPHSWPSPLNFSREAVHVLNCNIYLATLLGDCPVSCNTRLDGDCPELWIARVNIVPWQSFCLERSW